MTPEQEGAYIRLLALSWQSKDCSLPDDDAALAALSRLGERWDANKAVIRAMFQVANGRLVNNRLLKELGRKQLKEVKQQELVPSKIKFADDVEMTEAQHQSLVKHYGAETTALCITKLSAYKGATGKKYLDDYRAILSWVVDAVQAMQKRQQPQGQQQFQKGGQQQEAPRRQRFWTSCTVAGCGFSGLAWQHGMCDTHAVTKGGNQ